VSLDRRIAADLPPYGHRRAGDDGRHQGMNGMTTLEDTRTAQPQAGMASAGNASQVSPIVMPPALAVFGSILWLLVASPMLVETDTYRYASGLLALIALFYYMRAPIRPGTNWLGFLCMAWGLYVVLRFAVTYWMTPAHDLGASDWLYAFPFFFPILGIAFLLHEPFLERIVAAFFALALIMLVATQHFALVFAGETVRPLIMNNQIHGAVACGMMLIFTLFWLLHYLTEPSGDRRIARFAFIVSPFLIVLCLIAIYGAKSKGVWLALAITLPLLALSAVTYLRMKTGLIVVVCGAMLLIAGIYAVRHNLDKTAGPTVSSAIAMIEGMSGSEDMRGVVDQTIGSANTPVSMDERLQLWANSGEVISSAPVFGWGSEWLDRWKQTKYAHVQYTLLHNGYLEILIRYGLFGAAVMGFILASFIRIVHRAHKAGIIPRAAWHAYAICLFYFALTLLSNSNNRLAIGESYALASSAFACWCFMRLRGERLGMASSLR
jgi:O-antigen ligase